MHNPESGNQITDNQNQQWGEGILPQDNFYQFREKISEAPSDNLSDEEIKQILIAKKREQLKNHPEAKTIANNFSKKLAVVALSLITLVGGGLVVKDQARGKDILGSEQAKRHITELENVEKVILHGNVRSDPETTNSQDTNVYTSIDDEVTIEIPDGDKVLIYRDEHDPNGAYYGLSTDTLENEDLISKNEARNDRDKTVWVNEQNVRIIRAPENPTFPSE